MARLYLQDVSRERQNQVYNEQIAKDRRTNSLIRERVNPNFPSEALALEMHILRLRPLDECGQRGLLKVRVEHEHGGRSEWARVIAIGRKGKLSKFIRHERRTRGMGRELELRGVVK